MKRFDGRAVLVTGASSGIGLASAKILAAEGARIVGVARNAERLESALATLPGDGHRCVQADASQWKEMEPALAIGKELGGYAGAVCAAGTHDMRPLSLIEASHLNDSYTANVTTAVLTSKLVTKCARREGASIVWLSSVAALRATVGFGAYSASKGALLSAARVAAAELANRKIRVNVIVAGVVETAMSESWLGRLTPEQRDAVVKTHLLGLGTPADVAEAVAFLLSDSARWVTGSTLHVDGGLSVR